MHEEPAIAQVDLKRYTTEMTRVHNKRIAPEGMIFLVVRTTSTITKDHRKYIASGLLPYAGLTEEMKTEAFEQLYQDLKAKYSL